MTSTFTWASQVDEQATITYRTRVAKFGDGYSQATADGLNNRISAWPVKFTVSDTDATAIIAFLDGLKGYQSFYWTPPLDVQGFFRCASWQHTAHGAGWNTIHATFEEVFSP